MRYQVSGRAPSFITAALALMLALGMQLVAPDRATARTHGAGNWTQSG